MIRPRKCLQTERLVSVSTANLLYKEEYPINDQITIRIPTIGEVLEDEDSYNAVLSVWTSTPADYMVFLDDNGIDFTSLNDYDLFLILAQILASYNTSLFFGDLDFSKFRVAEDIERKQMVLLNTEDNIVIDSGIYYTIAAVLRKITASSRTNKVPAGEETKKYMIERERVKMNRRKNRQQESQIETLITAMVCTQQYKYDYEGTRSLTVYQFYECVKQVIKKVDYENRMIGVYAGTVSVKDLSNDDLNWLIHK